MATLKYKNRNGDYQPIVGLNVQYPRQEYVTVDAYSNLPETGSKDTVYRVSNYNGSTSQVDASVYSEYAWNGSQYILLCVNSQIGEVFDISAYHATSGELAKYADLAAALNSNNGGGVPQSLQKGGMSIKFVRSSDNKYVQYRYLLADISSNKFTNVNNWCLDDSIPGFETIQPDSVIPNSYVYNQDGTQKTSSYYNTLVFNVNKNDEYIIRFPDKTSDVIELIALFNSDSYRSDISVRGGSFTDTIEYHIIIPDGINIMKLTEDKSIGQISIRKSKYINHNTIGHSDIEDNSVGSNNIINGAVTENKIGNNAVTENKIKDGEVTNGKLSLDVRQRVIYSDRTYNLYDKGSMYKDGYILNNRGTIVEVEGWAITDFIPVKPNTVYYFSATYWGRNYNFAWYASDKSLLQMDDSSQLQGAHTSPSNAAYLVCVIKSPTLGDTKDFMVAESSEQLEYVPYRQIKTEQISDFSSAVKDAIIEGGISIIKKSESSKDYYYFYDGVDYIKAQYPYTDCNNTFNFSKIHRKGKDYIAQDDVAPMHILNTTLGGNHAQPITKATITGHGFSSSDIGSAWVYSGTGAGNGKTFYLVEIYDENTAGFLSENRGTYSAPAFYPLNTGTLTKSGSSTTKTISGITSYQLWPSARNIQIRFVVNGKGYLPSEIAYDTPIYGKTIDVVETFETVNPVSQLNHIINNSQPENNAIRTEHTFRIMTGLNVLFFTTHVILEDIAFQDFLYAMKKPFGKVYSDAEHPNDGLIKYYIPNSEPLSIGDGNYFDCRTPHIFPSNPSVSEIWVNNTDVHITDYPCNRVLQYDTDNDCGVAMGIFTELGVGKKLNNYTDRYFELRIGSGAIYPTPTNSRVVGNTLQSGNIYTGVMYWGFFDADLESADNRMSMYHFELNNSEYCYIDYKGSKLDKVELNNKFNGKKIEVIESSNAELVTMGGDTSVNDIENNVYNGGFYVNAQYVTGETCYIVLKIS